MPHAAPSRYPPTATSDLEAGAVLKLGEFQSEVTLNLSEARIILQKTLATRVARGGGTGEETEVTAKTRDYLEIFAVFKDLAEAQQVEGIINSYGENLERFEKSQLGSLVPTCSDEAKALVPSLEKKVEDGTVTEEELEGICRELQRLKRQAQL
jgi:DNA-directed RNA polymerase II subunit RPB4